MRWDKEKLPEPNSHVYDKDDTKIIVYNVRKWPRKKGWEKRTRAKKIKKYITKRSTLDSWLNDSGYADEDFYISYSYFFFQSTHDRYFLSRIRLVLFPTLYKFIVWACWAKTQSYLGFKSKLVLTNSILQLSKINKFGVHQKEIIYCFYKI